MEIKKCEVCVSYIPPNKILDNVKYCQLMLEYKFTFTICPSGHSFIYVEE